MELSIVIVNYKVKDILDECLCSIFENLKGINFEIILVDNDSCDGSIQMLTEKYAEVLVLQNNINVGFASASNQGMKIASGDYILLLNPDTRFQDASFLKMWNFIRKKKRNCIVGPKLLNKDGSLQYSAFKDKPFRSVFTEATFLNRLFGSDYFLDKQDAPGFVDSVFGAAMLFSRDLLNSVGYFDEDLLWAEDIDLCCRVREAGGSVYYFPETTIVHHGGVSSEKNLKYFYSNYHIGRFKYIVKHRSFFYVIFSEAFILFHFFSRIMILAFLFPFFGSRRMEMSAYLSALKKNIRYILRMKSR